MPGLPVGGDPFEPRLTILPLAQAVLWPELSEVPAHFTLYGGTGLALHLGHRQSVDFDFFSLQEIDPGELLRSLPFLREARVSQVAPNTLSAVVARGAPVSGWVFGVTPLARPATATAG